MSTASRKLGELLVDQRLLSKDDLEAALATEASTGMPMARILTDEGLVREEDLLRTVAIRLKLPFVDLDDALLDPDAVARLSVDDARRLVSIPVEMEEDALVVAVPDPFDTERHRQLEQLTRVGVVAFYPVTVLVHLAEMELGHGVAGARGAVEPGGGGDEVVRIAALPDPGTVDDGAVQRDFDEVGCAYLLEQHAVGMNQEVIRLARYPRADLLIGDVGHAVAVDDANTPALSIYEREGFHRVLRRTAMIRALRERAHDR